MKKRLNSVVSLFLSFVMLCGGMMMPLAHAAQDADGLIEGETLPSAFTAPSDEYEIYPTPHEITYGEGTITLPETLPAVFGPVIDSYTKTRAEKALAEAGITLTDAAASGVALRVGVYGTNDAAEQYFRDKGLADSTIFEKTDAYQLVVNDDGISVLGKDTDAAFYGLTTLKRIFQQVKNREVRKLDVKDYSDVALRGFIEGYYGNPWSNEDRAELMKFGGELKMNIYFYAPKDDPKHNAKWRELYTDEELKKIAALAQVGEESKCRFGFALHTFMYNPVRFDGNYDADLAVVKAKFEQVIKAGVRQIAVLADDAGVPGGNPQNYVRLMTDLTDWVSSAEMQTKYPGLKTSIPFCPNDYMGNGSGNQIQTLSAAPVAGGQTGGLPQSVPLVMTCGTIWGRVSNNFLNTFNANTNRTPFLWVNWPCSDNGKDLLVMGGFDTILQPGVVPDKVQGIMLNPMQQSEPSEVAIFANADYAWHIWPNKDAADKAWHDSFKYVDHMSYEETDASAALRELSKHMIYENVYNPFPESVELKPQLDAFKAKLKSGAPIAEDVPALKTEFQKLSDAATLYLKDGRERLNSQIHYWLNSWQDTTAAALSLLDALVEIETGDGGSRSNNRILTLYTEAQARYEKSKTYGYHYIDHTEYAKVGSQEIQPFVKTMLDKVADNAKLIMDPTIVITRPITSRTDTPEGGLDAMVDGKTSTEAVFKTPNSISIGTYVGVQFSRAIAVDAVRFELGREGNAEDTFNGSKLQYTEDGTEWKDIPDAAYTHGDVQIEKTGLGLAAVKGIRLIATEERNGTWLGVKEIYVNDLPEPKEPQESNRLTGTPFVSSNISIKGGALNNIIDDSNTSFVHLAENPYKGDTAHQDMVPSNGAIGLNFGKAEKLGHISITQDSGIDKMTNAVLEYSVDGNEPYIEIADVSGNVDIDVSNQNITAQYVRLRTKDYTAGWVKIFDFTVEKADNTPKTTLIRTDRWSIYSGVETNLFDGDDSTFVWYNTGANDNTLVGDYIGVDLGQEIAVGTVRFVVGAGDDDKWSNYDLEYSTDNADWKKVKSYVGNAAKDIVEANLAGAKARYIRLRNTQQRQKWVKFSEISVLPYDPDTVLNTILYKSNDAQVSYPSGDMLGDSATLSATSVTLPKDGYIGIALPSIRTVGKITADYGNAAGVQLEVGKNTAEMQPVTLPLTAPENLRYIRLRNTGEAEATFALNKLVATFAEATGPKFDSSNMGNLSPSADARSLGTTGNLFDGDVSTSVKFCDTQQTDKSVTYDLGRIRSISKLEIIVRDSEIDYVRNGKVQIAEDKNGPWTDVIEITSNVATAHRDCSALNAGWTAASGYPNYVSKSGTIAPQDARYLRIVFTDNFTDRWLVANEILINGGEYIPAEDPAFTVDPPEGDAASTPAKLIDGNITTGFTPKMDGKTEGSLVYHLSDRTHIGQINILQSSGAISNAKVEVRIGEDEWIEIGTLSQAFNSLYVPVDKQNVFDIRLTWGDVAPTFYELLIFDKGVIPLDTSRLQSLVDRTADVATEDEGKYDAAMLKEYREAKAAAQTLLGGSLDQFTQQDINDAYDRLTAAAEQLADNGELEKSKDVLRGLISDVANDEQKYTPMSWQAYLDSAAYQQAQDALEGDDVAAIHAARTALTEEVKKLVLRADRTQLNQLLAQIDALQQSDYTANSFTAFKAEVERIRTAMADENLVQADADKLLNELVAAKEKLVRKPSSSHSSSGSNTTTTTTTTTTKPDGTKVTTTVNRSTGETTVTSVTPDGVKTQTVTDKDGKTNITATVPADAAKKDGPVALPAQPVDPEKGTQIQIMLPKTDDGVTVSIPLEKAAPGTVAVLIGKDGSETVLTGAIMSDGKLLVPLDGSASIKIKDNGKTFVDVPNGNWAADAIQFVASRELFQGTGAGRFSPQEPMTRAMFVAVLYRLAGTPAVAGVPPFSDVAQEKYYTDAVVWANQRDIVNGIGDKYAPDAAITREQLAVMLFRYAKSEYGDIHEAGGKVSGFTDARSVSPWAVDAVAWAVENGILKGSNDNKLHPRENATRAEVATMLQRFIMMYLN